MAKYAPYALTSTARTILRSRLRRHPGLDAQTQSPIDKLSNADLVQIGILLGLNIPDAEQCGMYDDCKAAGQPGGQALSAADAVGCTSGGVGMVHLTDLGTMTPRRAPADPAVTSWDAADAEAETTPAPAAPTPEDETTAKAKASVAGALALFGQGDMAGFQGALMGLAMEAHKPAPVQVQTYAPDLSKIKGTVPNRTGRKTLQQAGIKADSNARDDATALDTYDAADAPRLSDAYVWPTQTAPALAALSQGGTVFLCGPAGTGKTTFAQQIAARYGRPFVRISCDDQTEASTLTGMTVPDANGGTKWQDGQLAAAIRRPGTVILVDEPSVARPGALFVLQALLDDDRALNVAETGERIPAAPGVMFILADNTNGTGDESGAYEGTRRLNRAFLDRADVTIKLDYMPVAQEAQTLTTRTAIKAPHALALAKFAALTRSKAESGAVSHGIGIRRLFALARQITAGVAPDLAFQLAVLETAPFEDREPLRQMWTAQIAKGTFQ